jgi:hypothetical protein
MVVLIRQHSIHLQKSRGSELLLVLFGLEERKRDVRRHSCLCLVAGVGEGLPGYWDSSLHGGPVGLLPGALSLVKDRMERCGRGCWHNYMV